MRKGLGRSYGYDKPTEKGQRRNKMEKEFNLSEKRKELFKEIIKNCDYPADFVDYVLRKVEEQDKEFIKRDYDLINLLITETIDFREFMIRRNKLAGEKLI